MIQFQSKPQFFLRLLAVIILATAASACVSSGGNIIGLEDDVSSSSQHGVTAHTIFMATSRARSDDPTEFFSGERASGLTLGEAIVTIPPGHATGLIEKPKSGNPIPSKHFVVKTPDIFEGESTFESRIKAALENRQPGARDILLFVHGYNVNFSSAVLRIAQFVNDTGFEGVPVLFSWASRGKTLDYVYDINSALQARNSLVELADILAKMPANNVDVVAHSMGNLLVVETLLRLKIRNEGALGKHLRRVILASPDIDVDLFESQLIEFPDVKDRVYVLVSADDKALGFSRRIAGGVSRVGASDPTALSRLGVNVIDLSEVEDSTSVHHTKFASSPEVVQLIGRSIQQGNSLSAQTEVDPLQGLAEGMLRGITFIPSALLTGTPSTILGPTFTPGTR